MICAIFGAKIVTLTWGMLPRQPFRDHNLSFIILHQLAGFIHNPMEKKSKLIDFFQLNLSFCVFRFFDSLELKNWWRHRRKSISWFLICWIINFQRNWSNASKNVQRGWFVPLPPPPATPPSMQYSIPKKRAPNRDIFLYTEFKSWR